jgi:L-lactate dehydrogenase complex protein LldG
MSTVREAFLSRVREAARSYGSGSVRNHVPPVLNERLARLVPPDADTRTIFVERATRAGMKIVESETPIAAAVDSLRSRECRSVVLSFTDMRVRAAVELACRAAGIEVLEGARSAFNADTGITDAEMLIAETGSVVVASGAGRSRLAAFAPGLHIVLAARTPILADLLDLAGAGGFAGDAASRVMISGPSKTADIEGVLVTGVHGPGEIIIVLGLGST